MEEESKGKGLDDYQDEDIEDALNNLDPADKKYLSRRDLDEHNYIKGTERDKEQFNKDRAKVAAAVAAMVRALEQAMRARTRCRQNRFQRAGKIDKTRLTQIAKSLSKEVFFKTKKGEKLETAVEIVIDESGSMGGRECQDVRRVAIAVSEALAQLNIPFEVTGSTTKYGGGDHRITPRNGLARTNPIVYDHFKTFGQQWINVRHNMSQSRAFMHNVDGEVVEYAARRLLERPEARKIVLTLSDGLPDAGHGNGQEMGQNIVRTCERARKAGVEVYAFGIGTNAPAQYYGKDNFVYLPEGDDLGPKFASEFVAIVSDGRFKVGR
jgi:cobalamin biosynthesis protein CobT